MEQNNPNGTRRISLEEEEEMQQLYLLERLGKYSTTVKTGDINVKSESMDPTADYLVEVQSDQNDFFDEEAESDHNNGGVTNAELALVHDSNTFVRVPCAGQSIEYDDLSLRDIPNGCAICLSEFEVGDRITWASNRNCVHCFHEHCILKWMLAVAKKKRQQRSSNIGPRDDVDDDPLQSALNFPKLCPCCRRQFISSADILQRSISMVVRSGESVESGGNRVPVQLSSRVPQRVSSTITSTSVDLTDDRSMVPLPEESVVSGDNRIPVQPSSIVSSIVTQRDASTIASASIDLTDDNSMVPLPDLSSPPNGDTPLMSGEGASRGAVSSHDNSMIPLPDLSSSPNGDRPLKPAERAFRGVASLQVNTITPNQITFEDFSMVPRPAVASPSRIDLSSDDLSMIPQSDAPSPVYHVRTAALGGRQSEQASGRVTKTARPATNLNQLIDDDNKNNHVMVSV